MFQTRTPSSKEGIMYYQIKKPMTAQLSHKICNILPVMHILIGCNYIDLFYGKSKIHTFKKMFLKPELTALIQFLKTPNLNFFNKLLILFFLYYITDQSPRWLSLCNSICKKWKRLKVKDLLILYWLTNTH